MTCPLSVTLAVTTFARIAASACGSRLKISAMQQAMTSRTRRRFLLTVDITLLLSAAGWRLFIQLGAAAEEYKLDDLCHGKADGGGEEE